MPRHKDKNRGFVYPDGRITIPKEIREKLQIEEGMVFEAEVTEDNCVKIKFLRVEG